MLNDFFQNLKQELRVAIHKRKHPFKYVTLSTIDHNAAPQSRTVVMREVDQELQCIIFTDARTNKIDQLTNNNKACLLAYHPKKLLQVKLNGILEPITDTVEIKRLFQKVSENAIKDYTTTTAPGTAIANPDQVKYKSRQESHFIALQFIPYQIEALQLKRPNHLRAIFKKEDNWVGQWLVP